MKLILKDNIENLGKKGDIVNVAPGFGRNYLVPKKMALEVTATNIKMIEMVQKSLRKGLEKEMKVYQSVIEKLNAVTLTFARKAGEKDVIFGSVNVTDIRDALAELNFEVEKKKILLDEPIKRLGNYTVPIKVFHDDKALIKLEVNKEGGSEDEETPLEPESLPAQTEEAEVQPEAEVVDEAPIPDDAEPPAEEAEVSPAPEPEPVEPEVIVEETPAEAEPEAAALPTEEAGEPEAEVPEVTEAPETATDAAPENKPDPEAKS